MTISLRLIGIHNTGVFGQGAAEIPAYDPSTRRLFVVNAQAVTVDVLDISNPANPIKIGEINASRQGGVANSVAVNNGILAVALEASVKTNPGSVAFFQTNSDFSSGNVTPLKVVTVGAQPDMVTFTPDGKKVLTANEGEPNSYNRPDSVDPEGSISIIDISNGVVNATVTTVNFNAFDSRKDELIARGVRIFGPNATVSQDLEPEYIAVSPDSKTAYVTLQENNAIAVVDIDRATVRDIIPLGFVDHSTTRTKLTTYRFQNLPPLGTTIGGQQILLGGFSGLWFEGRGKDGTLKFITHTDRGPNAEAQGSLRPFLLPSFAPEIVRFQLNPNSGEITITQRISLKRPDGTPLTGLPNIYIPGGNTNTPYNDEIPVDLRNNPIYPLDPLGADLEGIAVARDGTFWMVDEYRPAIYHFDANGTLIERFVPVGTNPPGSSEYGIEALPAVLAQRRQNRGFEAVAIDSDRNKLYAFVQSPIRNPVTLSNTNLNNLNNIRIVEFDLTTKTTTAQYLYRLDNPNLGTPGNTRADKIGDAVYIGNGEFLVVERDDDAIDSDPLSNIEKKVYRFSLAGATDITPFTQPIDVGGGVFKTVDEMTPSELAARGINLVKKTLYVDLAAVGYNAVEKVEGLAYLGDGKIAVINDNDFGVANITLKGDGTFTPDPNPEPVLLGIIQVQPTALDVSDRDNRINIANWPVLGMFQPDAIATYRAGDGKIYLVTANEGDAREWPGFGEEVRVASLRLDGNAFPNASQLQRNDQLGRLTVTTTLGDTDRDGDFDKLYLFGTRSFSIWDSNGNLVFDSGSQFEEIIARLIAQGQLPSIAFNANNDDNNSFDTRSDNKGPEPEGVVLGTIRDRTYAFIGLERIGGVMVYDITDPLHPTFVQYVNNRNFVDAQGNILPVRLPNGRSNPAVGDLGPEGLAFISAQDSPTGTPLLVVSNEISGTTSIWEVELPNYTLQILHASDHEAGIPALQDIIGFSAVLNALASRYPNTIKLASGDLFIPGPFFNASRDLYGQPGIADILVHNRLGWDVAVLGNHEFDAGTSAFYTLLAPNRNIRGVGIDANRGYPGAAFPYLATNLDYSTDSSRLKELVVPAGGAPKQASLTQSVVLEIGGERIGVVGAVVPYLPQITNIGGITMLTNPNSRDVEENARLIANSVQPFVDQLVSQGINKIILMTHLQQFEVEQALARKLRNVDIVIGGGSHRVMANPDDALRQDETQRPPQLLQPYPQKLKDADGKDIYLVNTGANYRYVGQLVVDFDARGNVVNVRDESGPYPTDLAGVNRLYPENITTFEQVKAKADPQLVQIVDNVGNFINSLDAKVYGNTAVFLNGLRESVRREETNLGNLTADANLWYARRFGVTVDISVKNGGGDP
ncbi:MAG: choice-of-anchor I family protein [Geminocystis sp.]|nr:choice-of-anchor I family protein [Geminocystis sp.]